MGLHSPASRLTGHDLRVGFLLLVSLVLSALVSILAQLIGTSVVVYTLNLVMSLALISALLQ